MVGQNTYGTSLAASAPDGTGCANAGVANHSDVRMRIARADERLRRAIEPAGLLPFAVMARTITANRCDSGHNGTQQAT
jgi:hypothetical protein